jgi:hypothetical protein
MTISVPRVLAFIAERLGIDQNLLNSPEEQQMMMQQQQMMMQQMMAQQQQAGAPQEATQGNAVEEAIR